MPDIDRFGGDHAPHAAFDVKTLFKLINETTDDVKKKLEKMKGSGSSVSIGEMFEMQLLMNKLSQMSELTTSVTSALHTAITAMARNVKG